ncbi:putative sporulation protein YyaC [Anaerospora hongkongensis]|uniref:Putative sporulation protein YyaC n=1 Tax=Anaerospora hongkongensis TaxID=244830 RepID=A0A4R1PTC9_9FIRM|nr:spore protease YyaC [Anaerospora hongkongensis]TCL35032.1 putative sporulation protein YyaC [Anaerospora hongkongensis]
MGKITGSKLTTSLTDTNARDKVQNYLLTLLESQEGYRMRPLVVLCIGSDRYTGDALGPLIGSHLLENTDCLVYGSLDHPIHAGNLVETIHLITRQYHHPLIIAVDACLGKTNEIGNIEVWEGGLEAGIAVGNRLPCVGHISIIGVVNAGGKIGYLDLQSTPLATVMKLSKVIGSALQGALTNISQPVTAIR